jgi:hypothetical protein
MRNGLVSILVLLAVFTCTAFKGCSGTSNSLTVNMDPKCTHGNGPNGAGVVKLDPEPTTGDCKLDSNNPVPVSCKTLYAPGKVVTLTAIPDPRPGPDGHPISTFEGFSGLPGCAPGAATCQITMDTNKDVTATFCARTF